MNTINFIKEVELKYDVKSIKVNNMEVWPFLRMAYCFAYNKKYNFNKEEVRISLWAKIKRIGNIFYGFKNLFKKYDYVVFVSREDCKKLNDNMHIDQFGDVLIHALSDKKTLLVEESRNINLVDIKKISYKNIISHDFFHFFGEFYFFNKNILISNEYILKEINRKYKLNIKYKTKILKFLNYMKFYRRFFNFYKPKAIFMIDCYSLSHQSAISAAQRMKIKTIEIQHGVINDSHPAYNIFSELDSSFFPEYLLCFGNYVKKIFTDNNYFIKNKNVLTVGSMYIEYMNKEYQFPKKVIKLFRNFRKKYKKIISVSVQLGAENKLISFLKKSANINDKDILYIFAPRNPDKDYSNIKFPPNIIILKNLNTYQIIKQSDIHSTLYSTCALEAPALGVPNILINIDGYAEKIYSKLLTNKDVTRFIETEEEFVSTILDWHPKSRNEIMNLHKDFYEKNHKKSLKIALGKIGINLKK